MGSVYIYLVHGLLLILVWTLISIWGCRLCTTNELTDRLMYAWIVISSWHAMHNVQ